MNADGSAGRSGHLHSASTSEMLLQSLTTSKAQDLVRHYCEARLLQDVYQNPRTSPYTKLRVTNVPWFARDMSACCRGTRPPAILISSPRVGHRDSGDSACVVMMMVKGVLWLQ